MLMWVYLPVSMSRNQNRSGISGIYPGIGIKISGIVQHWSGMGPRRIKMKFLFTSCISSRGYKNGLVHLCEFVRPTLCTTSTVQDYVVHHWPALCTMVHKGDLCLQHFSFSLQNPGVWCYATMSCDVTKWRQSGERTTECMSREVRQRWGIFIRWYFWCCPCRWHMKSTSI